MKVYSIGREAGCDIVINDPSNVVSRRHATLNVMPSGKMTIVDLSQNGTYVNGIRITSNAPVPVTRNDNVSFAHIAQLDWTLVQNPKSNMLRYAALALLAIVLVVGCVFLIDAINDDGTIQQSTSPTTMADSVKRDSAEKAKAQQAEQERVEEIKKQVQDSIDKAKKSKAPEKAKKNENKKEQGGNKKEKDDSQDNQKEETQKKKRFS